MCKQHIHYEAAFQDYLRSRGVPYVPVDETRRAIFSGAKIKSFDFLVYMPDDRHWIVDIKGRQFPYTNAAGGRQYWENWVTLDDIDSLSEWEAVFGQEFEPCFVFAYLLGGPPDRWPSVRPHFFRNQYYVFYTIGLQDYRAHCRERSDRWQTVAVPRPTFRRLIRPVSLRGVSDAGKPAFTPEPAVL